jgi:hypothetical protein
MPAYKQIAAVVPGLKMVILTSLIQEAMDRLLK